MESEGRFWPGWLSQDVEGLRTFTLGYPSTLLRRTGTDLGLHARSVQTISALQSQGIGTRPFIIVAHSLGGLLTKQVVRDLHSSGDSDAHATLKNLRHITFVATPHFGSSLASVLFFWIGGISTDHIQNLRRKNQFLYDLNDATRSICHSERIATKSFYETLPIPILGMPVTRESADPGIGDVPAEAIESNHLNITRPRSRRDQLYKHTLHTALRFSREKTNIDRKSVVRTFETGAALDPITEAFLIAAVEAQIGTGVEGQSIIDALEAYSSIPTGVGQSLERIRLARNLDIITKMLNILGG